MWKNTSSSSNPVSPIGVVSPAVAAPTYRLKYQGRRFAQIVKLKPEFEEQYKACHAKVWPEVLKQIKDCNIEDCELCPSRPVSPFLYLYLLSFPIPPLRCASLFGRRR
jgi:hypothetical protein